MQVTSLETLFGSSLKRRTYNLSKFPWFFLTLVCYFSYQLIRSVTQFILFIDGKFLLDLFGQKDSIYIQSSFLFTYFEMIFSIFF